MKIKISEELLKIIISSILFILSFFFKEKSLFYFSCLAFSYSIIAFELYVNCFKNIKEKEFFDENILMIIATIGAFFIGEYLEAVVVVLLFQIGEYLSDVASNRTRDSIISLMDLRTDKIHLLKSGKVNTVDTKLASVNDIFRVLPGEIIPLDGKIIAGASYLNTANLTGESTPVLVKENDSVMSGTVNLDSVLDIQATSTYETSTASKILELMENSNNKKTKTEKFITRFSKIYTPIVVVLAILITVIPMFFGKSFSDNIYNSLVFLVMSCPCALVISVPLGFFQGIGRCSREGILVKGSNELDCLTNIDMIAFDKTGTITEGKFEVREVKGINKKDDLLKIAAFCEVNSNHPIADAIKKAYGKKVDADKITKFREISGKGIEAVYQKKTYYLGNDKLMKDKKIEVTTTSKNGTVIYMATENEYLGYILISDKIKSSVKQTISVLRKLNIKKMVVLSGDNEKEVARISKEVGIDEYYANLLPQNKVEKMEKLLVNNTVMFVGDGMNDAPVMKLSNIGVSMGNIGSDAAIDASDIVLMKDDISKIPVAIKISKLTKNIIRYNIGFAISTKVLVLSLAILGFSSIWMAVFADVGVTLISILNTFIIQKKKI